MIWADRFGFAWFTIVAAVTAFFTLNPAFMFPFGEAVFWFDLIVIGAPWALLRLIDFAVGGPAYRRREHRRDPFIVGFRRY